uniref:Uncharacterized protein n=1 Tax=Anopheles stephensi TaxID=30069 RepID=A0A182YA71_ANOST
MRRVISLVLCGLFCCSAVLSYDKDETPSDGVAQSGRIVNGEGVKIKNHKYALSIHLEKRFSCGASIITASHALTAARCVYLFRKQPSRLTVRGGSTSATTGGFLSRAAKIVVHPFYNSDSYPGTSDFDAAIVTVASNAVRGKTNMAPIALQTSKVPVGTSALQLDGAVLNLTN